MLNASSILLENRPKRVCFQPGIPKPLELDQTLTPSIIELAIQLRDNLQRTQQRLVLAESCTAGRVAATLGCLPGISNWLCGSFVIYRNDSKARWLGISHNLLDDPEIGPVSKKVTQQLALAALERTPEAELCVAITGDIGPFAPVVTDGLIFCAVANRELGVAQCAHHRLAAPAPIDNEDVDARIRRLDEATRIALQTLIQFMSRLR